MPKYGWTFILATINLNIISHFSYFCISALQPDWVSLLYLVVPCTSPPWQLSSSHFFFMKLLLMDIIFFMNPSLTVAGRCNFPHPQSSLIACHWFPFFPKQVSESWVSLPFRSETSAAWPWALCAHHHLPGLVPNPGGGGWTRSWADTWRIEEALGLSFYQHFNKLHVEMVTIGLVLQLLFGWRM